MRFAVSTILALFLAALQGRAADPTADAVARFTELKTSGKLFDRTQFKTVRAAYAEYFEAKHGPQIRDYLFEDADAILKWFDAHPTFKEELFLAIGDHGERKDSIPDVFARLRELWKHSPDAIEKNPELAIAVCIVWDQPKNVYDYGMHQRRTKSKMPNDLANGLDNFRYLIDNEKVTEGRLKFLPWEMLLYVVDNRTPLSERKYAQEYYTKNKTGKSWHQDVPYDNDMLRGEREPATGLQPHLKDLDYTLSNIRKVGGVCAMQADFAARIGKSVAIPAAYCSGESSYRGMHAWTLAAQTVKSGDALAISFLSDGRFVGFERDAFYTGNVVDPQIGERFLDRDLERRWSLVAKDRVGKRHVDLAMKIYAFLIEQQKWSAKEHVEFLDKVLKIQSQADGPWNEIAGMIRSGEITAEEKKLIAVHINTALTKFVNYPDFTERLFRDFETVLDPMEQVKLFSAAITSFEKLGRPDLACAARLQLTDVLIEQKKHAAAFTGLLTTVNRFPTEGRYVPRLTAKLQEVAADVKGGKEKLAALYLELIPKLVAHYGKDGLADYHKKMYNQALRYMEENGLTKQAALLKQRVGTL